MADEFTLEDLDDDMTVEFIKNYVSQELKEKLTDDDLDFFLDTICDYYCDHGTFEQEPDSDGCVDVDVDAVAAYLMQESQKHQIGSYDLDDMIQIVNAELEYGDQLQDPEPL